MNFEENIRSFVSRVKIMKDKINTEEATKTSLVMPFFQMLGYDIFNPNEFLPEFIADVGIKKGEKVDYAIVLDEKVMVLIEVKSINEQLNKHDSQLFRYFGTSTAKFAILTNGINFKFFTDLEETNKMDTTPFLDINLLELKDNDISEIKKFHKDNFNINSILSTASDLKYFGLVTNVLKEQFNKPSSEFVKIVLNNGIYDGVKTQNVIEKFTPILKKSISFYINELINETLQNAMQKNEGTNSETEQEKDKTDNIVTTIEEMESFYIVKSILAEYLDLSKITYKDTYNYFGILLDNKVTKWICRIYLRENMKYVVIPNELKEEIKYKIDKVSDLYKYRKQLIQRVKNLTVDVTATV